MSSADKANPYERDLDKNPANYAPLTPLGFIERAATSIPDISRSFTERAHHVDRNLCALPAARFSARASGNRRRRHVAAMLANTPEMLECHFGVPMAARSSTR